LELAVLGDLAATGEWLLPKNAYRLALQASLLADITGPPFKNGQVAFSASA
jgi:hypothetical protein